MLQVAIHSNDVFSAGIVESGGKRGSLPEITAKLDHDHTAIDGCDLLQVHEGEVAAAIVDEDHLEGLAGGFHDVFQAVIELGDVLLFVVKGHNDGEAYGRVGLFNAHGNRP